MRIEPRQPYRVWYEKPSEPDRHSRVHPSIHYDCMRCLPPSRRGARRLDWLDIVKETG